ncbi:unnamed protein product [Haemonchus placei]|uniref:Uncharacterized protein n=1 Tax=Haemonchus placei TaxID=6290 RepID=A0A0N4WP72_HAEPC|nr:unnamed protein product [Haemonchus placei]
MMLMLRKNSDDVFYPPQQRRTSSKKRAQSHKETKKQRKPTESPTPPPSQPPPQPLSGDGEREQKRKRSPRKLSEALRNPREMLLRKKKSLGSTLSWDPAQPPSPAPSHSSVDQRSRIHSDGSDILSGDDANDKDGQPKVNIEGPRFELETSCGHCLLVAEYRSELLKNEIESAVKLLARRLGSTPRTRMPLQGMPNIVVSSISSDEDDYLSSERQNSSDRTSSLQTSEARHLLAIFLFQLEPSNLHPEGTNPIISVKLVLDRF